jgi:hypothetical protein
MDTNRHDGRCSKVLLLLACQPEALRSLMLFLEEMAFQHRLTVTENLEILGNHGHADEKERGLCPRNTRKDAKMSSIHSVSYLSCIPWAKKFFAPPAARGSGIPRITDDVRNPDRKIPDQISRAAVAVCRRRADPECIGIFRAREGPQRQLPPGDA